MTANAVTPMQTRGDEEPELVDDNQKNNNYTSDVAMVRLVEAHAVVDNDEEAKKNDDTMKQGEGKIAASLVNLQAPSDLPPGFRLEVQYFDPSTGQSIFGYVHVPEGGVYAGQFFEAEFIPPRPVLGRWSHPICDCCSIKDRCFCCLSTFFTPIAWGMLYDAQKQPLQQDGRGSVGYCWILMACAWGVYMFCVVSIIGSFDIPGSNSPILRIIQYVIVGLVIWVATKTRLQIRQQYSIPGNCCSDCLCGYCCGCCAAIQAYKQLSFDYKHPKTNCGVRNCVQPATIVVV